MNAAPFAYHRAADLQEAISLLQEHGESAKLIAGGHSLLPIMKLRLAEPERLIDIGRLAELQGVRQLDGGKLAIGALSTHSQVATNQMIQAAAPLLADTAGRVGDRQVRNRGTIGGALAHADAAADYPAAILALEATIVARGPQGERRIAARDFFVDFLTTALEPTEVLTAIELDAATPGLGWSYQKLANQASGYAIVGVAAIVALNSNSATDVRVGITGAAAVPWRADATEAALRGQQLDSATIARAASLADDGVESLLDDLHGSEEYRRRVTRGLTRRALEEAIQRG